jgi:zinc/manganese transport system substrate-binding protein/zinc transport system substrate-binding protein/manganese/iron transport system substrate-binding protein
MGRSVVSVVAACLAFLAGSVIPTLASEPLDVVVTIPVLKDFADRIGGPHVRVVSLLSGRENEHTYSPKPSDLAAVRRAKVVIRIGLGLEVWVGSLIKNAGASGLLVVTTSEGITRIADHAAEAAEHGHAGGNPHIWLDPENAQQMVRQIAKALREADPAHAADYRANEDRYLQELRALEADLLRRLQPVAERRIVVHHPAWPYFANRFGFHIVGEIIAQAGAEPSARHLQALMKTIREERVRVIVSEPQLNQKLPRILAQESGARVVVLTAMPGGVPGTDSYLDMLRYNVTALAKALEAS